MKERTMTIEPITDPDTDSTIGWVCTITQQVSEYHGTPVCRQFQGVRDTPTAALATAESAHERFLQECGRHPEIEPRYMF